jgi:hypothetical protein
MKAKESKGKQKGFHLLSFIFSNRAFSMGYGRKNQGIGRRLRLCAKRLKALFIPLSSLAPAKPVDSANRNMSSARF